MADDTVFCIIAFPTDVTIARNVICSSTCRDSSMNSTNVIRCRDYYRSYDALNRKNVIIFCVINRGHNPCFQMFRF
jgi:hypothetical protein